SIRPQQHVCTLFPYTTLFRSYMMRDLYQLSTLAIGNGIIFPGAVSVIIFGYFGGILVDKNNDTNRAMLLSISFLLAALFVETTRSEEHTSELQSRFDLVCRLL